jgi:DNA-binding response OmpR family regulator
MNHSALLKRRSTPSGAFEGATMNQVLLVNDNEEITARVATMLQDLGWEVYVATGEDVAFESLVASRPTMMVVDIEMEGGAGFESMSTGRRLYADLFIVATTRGGDRNIWPDVCASCGANDYVVGPISLLKMSAAIDDGFRDGLLDMQPHPCRGAQH